MHSNFIVQKKYCYLPRPRQVSKQVMAIYLLATTSLVEKVRGVVSRPDQ